MSQFWHGNWVEDSFKPTMLGNWQVPNWHPKWPCARHCAVTSFLADKTGRLLAGQPRSKRSPWGDYKGTWELPAKINRRLAERLSAPPRYKLAAWEVHKKHYEGPCGIVPASSGKDKATDRDEKPAKASNRIRQKTEKRRVPEKSTMQTNTQRKAQNLARANDAKTKSADKRMTARRDAPNKRIQKPKEEKSVAVESAKNEEQKIIREENTEEEILPRFKEDETETISKEHSAKRLAQETKADQRLKCPCAKNNLSPGTIPETRRKICPVHQRLRV